MIMDKRLKLEKDNDYLHAELRKLREVLECKQKQIAELKEKIQMESRNNSDYRDGYWKYKEAFELLVGELKK